MKQQKQIYIFDTTLRDGQQSPGAGMTFEDNLTYADYAHELGIDVLEAGFPAASQHDFSIVKAISERMTARHSNMTIAALCQLREEQVERTMLALQPSRARNKARVHTYVPVDPNLMQASLGKLAQNYSQIIDDVHRLIKLAVDGGFEVEFSAEGYSKMHDNFDFVSDLFRAAVSAGVKVINCPDTIGGAARWQEDNYFVKQMQKHADIIAQEFPEQEIIWSAHCHNDLGLALDNTMSAVFSGPAQQIEGCINGVGERAGNVALEQCIMTIDQFGEHCHPDYAFYTDIDLVHLKKISDFIAEKMLPRQPHSPISGDNAARHTSGGHTNAILKNPLAYQPFDPSRIGNEISFVFGPLSGSNHVKSILERYGFTCEHNDKTVVTQAIKDKYAERRKGVTDDEVVLAYQQYRMPIQLEKISYQKDNTDNATVELKGRFFDEQDPVINCCGENSALAAIDSAVKKYFPNIEITDYHSNACAGHTANAKCQSTIMVTVDDTQTHIGKAIDADINLAAIKAYINAVNQAYIHTHYRHRSEQSITDEVKETTYA